MKIKRKDALLYMLPETDEESELLMGLHLKIIKAHGWMNRESGRYLFMVYKPDNLSSKQIKRDETE